MSLNDRKNLRAQRLAAELHADDGVDPRTAFSRSTPRPAQNPRKTLQLCKEAARALRIALTCDCADPLLNDLEVLAVEPGANAAQLRVSLRPASATPENNYAELSQRLSAVSGFLRAAVATAINRRRAPELRFVILPPIGDAP